MNTTTATNPAAALPTSRTVSELQHLRQLCRRLNRAAGWLTGAVTVAILPALDRLVCAAFSSPTYTMQPIALLDPVAIGGAVALILCAITTMAKR